MSKGVDLTQEATEDGPTPQSFTGLASGLRKHGGMTIEKAGNERPDKEIILAKGGKGAGKTTFFADLPRPTDGKTVILSFDDSRSRLGLIERFGEVPEHIDLWELVIPDPDTGYGGYDASDVTTAELVVATTAQLLDRYRESGEADNIVLDYWQYFYERILTNYAKHRGGLDAAAPVTKMDPSMWATRTDAADLIFGKAKASCNARLVLTGMSENENEKLVSFDNPDGSTGWRKEKKMPRWVEKFLQDVHHVLHFRKTKEGGGAEGMEETTYDKQYFVEVEMTSDSARFPEGKVIDVTGDTIVRFYSEEEPEE